MQNERARVLIAGSYGHGNTGDEAILDALITQLRARMPELRLVVVAGDTEAVRQQFGVETVPWDDWAAIVQAVEQSDMVIQGGGGIFFDYTGFHPHLLFENGASDLAHYGGFSLLAELYGKPFMIYAVGVGPLASEDVRRMVSLAHRLADAITVRDPESRALLEEIGVESGRVEVTADPAFSLEPVDADRARTILSDHGIDLARPVIAITPRPWSYGIAEADWQHALADAVSAFAAARKAQVLLIPFQKGYDDSAVARIQERLAGQETFVLRSSYTPQEIAGVIGICDLLIGLRLHSLVFAILTATPAVALAYDPKVRDLARRIGHEEICIDLTELSELTQLLARAWEKREALSGAFAAARAEMRALAERNADVACALLQAQDATATFASREFLEMLGKAFYGRLQAIRVRDRVVAAQDENQDLREIIEIMSAEQWPPPAPPPETPDAAVADRLRAFLQSAVSESAAHMLIVYDHNSAGEQAASWAQAFADAGIPTISVEAEPPADPASPQGQQGNLFRLPVAALAASWDEVLYLKAPSGCRKILLLRSADPDIFRLVNHAHALGWITIYYPSRQEQRSLPDAETERYMVSNVEAVIVGSTAMKNHLQSIGVKQPRVVAQGENASDQVREILEVATECIQKSPVRLAMEGAHRG